MLYVEGAFPPLGFTWMHYPSEMGLLASFCPSTEVRTTIIPPIWDRRFCEADYWRKVATLHGLAGLFEGFSAKLDIVIDDMPSMCISPFVYDVRQSSWQAIVERTIIKHLH